MRRPAPESFPELLLFQPFGQLWSSQCKVLKLGSNQNSTANRESCARVTDLPERYTSLLPNKKKEIIVYCNGGIQSIYAVMYLAMKGYTDVKSLAGGFSKYLG